MKKRIILIVILGFSLIFMFCVFGYFIYDSKENISEINEKKEIVDVKKYYSDFVRTNKDINLYINKDNNYVVVGKISSGVELALNGIFDEYFKLNGFDEEYYVNYKNLDRIEELTVIDKRYEKYVPFGEKIITNDVTNFYDVDNNLIYKLDKSLELVILIKDDDRYGVIYNDKLLYVNFDDVNKVVEDSSVGGVNTKGIGVLNYHFFYDDTIEGEFSKCNQIICASRSQFEEHLEYFKTNNFFTPTMEELEMYIDGKIQLPKSVVITIDDGWRAKLGIEMLTKYKFNATMFLVTSSYNPKDFRTDYVEVHSHTHDMHNSGDCPVGQGGGIQCLSEEFILNDLKTSSEILGGSKVLCYPYYEYNDYSISMLKKAGYKMAFAGEVMGSDNLVKVGSDKYSLPRFVVVNYTTMRDLENYLG